VPTTTPFPVTSTLLLIGKLHVTLWSQPATPFSDIWLTTPHIRIKTQAFSTLLYKRRLAGPVRLPFVSLRKHSSQPLAHDTYHLTAVSPQDILLRCAINRLSRRNKVHPYQHPLSPQPIRSSPACRPWHHLLNIRQRCRVHTMNEPIILEQACQEEMAAIICHMIKVNDVWQNTEHKEAAMLRQHGQVTIVIPSTTSFPSHRPTPTDSLADLLRVHLKGDSHPQEATKTIVRLHRARCSVSRNRPYHTRSRIPPQTIF